METVLLLTANGKLAIWLPVEIWLFSSGWEKEESYFEADWQLDENYIEASWELDENHIKASWELDEN